MHFFIPYRKLLPTLQTVGYFGQLMAMELRFADTLATLLAIVVEQVEGVLAQGGDGYEVAGGEQCHAEVAEVPYEVERSKSTDEYKKRHLRKDGRGSG